MTNNQKDTKKTDNNSYGHNDFSGVNALVNKTIYEFANKKTEKLVTALYMVTDCMETEDALKEKLRLLGVQLLSDIYRLSTLLPIEKNTQISVSLNRIYEILSFIEIAYTIGYISEMNTEILKNEFRILITELESYQHKNKNFSFTLNEQMFEVERGERDLISNGQFLGNVFNRNQKDIKDSSSKRTNIMSFTNNQTKTKGVSNGNHNLTAIDYKKVKQERTDKIIAIIKDKKEATIKDIATLFTNCSEKTIQRELSDLIEKGQIQKTGAKRWSRYTLIPKS